MFVGIPQSDTPFAISKEHILIDELCLAAGRVSHQSNLTRIANQTRCTDTALPGKAVNHERNDAATSSIVDESIIIQIFAWREGEHEPLSHTSLSQIVPYRYFSIPMVNLRVLLVARNIINNHRARQNQFLSIAGLSEQIIREIIVIDLEDKNEELPRPKEDIIIEGDIV